MGGVVGQPLRYVGKLGPHGENVIILNFLWWLGFSYAFL